MDTLYLPTSKLLFFICHLFRSDQINERQYKLVKKMVMQESSPVFKAIEEFEQNHDEKALKQNIMWVIEEYDTPENDQGGYQGEDENYERNLNVFQFDEEETKKAQDYIQNNPEIPEEISSPLGTQLWRRKQKHKNNAHDVRAMLGFK